MPATAHLYMLGTRVCPDISSRKMIPEASAARERYARVVVEDLMATGSPVQPSPVHRQPISMFPPLWWEDDTDDAGLPDWEQGAPREALRRSRRKEASPRAREYVLSQSIASNAAQQSPASRLPSIDSSSSSSDTGSKASSPKGSCSSAPPPEHPQFCGVESLPTISVDDTPLVKKIKQELIDTKRALSWETRAADEGKPETTHDAGGPQRGWPVTGRGNLCLPPARPAPVHQADSGSDSDGFGCQRYGGSDDLSAQGHPTSAPTAYGHLKSMAAVALRRRDRELHSDRTHRQRFAPRFARAALFACCACLGLMMVVCGGWAVYRVCGATHYLRSGGGEQGGGHAQEQVPQGGLSTGARGAPE